MFQYQVRMEITAHEDCTPFIGEEDFVMLSGDIEQRAMITRGVNFWDALERLFDRHPSLFYNCEIEIISVKRI